MNTALAYDHAYREAIHAEIAAARTWYEEQRAKQSSLLRGR
jgi:hypothetical protein